MGWALALHTTRFAARNSKFPVFQVTLDKISFHGVHLLWIVLLPGLPNENSSLPDDVLSLSGTIQQIRNPDSIPIKVKFSIAKRRTLE